MRSGNGRTVTRIQIPFRAIVLLACVLLPAALPAPAVASEPWMWDQDEDGIDDRLTATFQQGISAAYENGDPEGRLRFDVSTLNNALQYGGYILYDHPPTTLDSLALAGAGAEVITRFISVPYIRVRALYPSLVAIAAQPGVERVEAVTLMFPTNWRTTGAVGIRGGGSGAAPALHELGGPTGSGSVVAILDTGINDTPIGAYPGHSDIAGKVLGGSSYSGPGPLGYTNWGSSVNPAQSTPGLSSYHATHVAGTIAGAGRDRTFGGMAPDARLVDVKVLDDSGTGYGLAEGLEWCLQNRTRVWDPTHTGIDVINLSLTSIDPSDGQDCVCRLVNAAAASGIVVVAAAGNDGRCKFIPAPGAADQAITVGALDLDVASASSRPALATFSNDGPRNDDLDGGHADELKPDLVAPGTQIAAAWGAPLGTGQGWRRSSGTSMAAATVSGVVALLRETSPTASPDQIREILRRTARHRTDTTLGCSIGADPYGIEPDWRAGFGFGELDALAAWEELVHETTTQYVNLSAEFQAGSGEIEFAWTTQRESGTTSFLVERADDLGGAPGTFTPVSPAVPAVGFSNLALGNRTTYLWSDPVPAGRKFWYRARTLGGPTTISSSIPARSEDPIGRAEITFWHNRPELDWTMQFGSGPWIAPPDWSSPLAIDADLNSAAPLPSADPEDKYQGILVRSLYASDIPAWLLPPSASHPWWFETLEGNSPDHSGLVTDFRIVVGMTLYQSSDPMPQLTIEGSPTVVVIPTITISGTMANGAPDAGPRWLRVRVNPARGPVQLNLPPGSDASTLTILDIQGRIVRRLPIPATAGESVVTWDGSNESGEETPSGRYFARLDDGTTRQVVGVVRIR
ncbi:MAG: S8 family serine peptidase [Candidatus Eisenbacteria bacterium]|nr:S8 family serine peptidase [Candidatus Eisenbacteria bacterium]